MSLRHDLEELVASWPFSEARAALRDADAPAGKPAGYWSRIGRGRVERELEQDGLSAEQIDAVVLTVEGQSVPTSEHIDLDEILADLKAREGRP